ncbi:MAG: HAMP domain-containing protein [Myxococcales bacterium]|nr:HAMP domain-containing protein [Myxococcales bacterium]
MPLPAHEQRRRRRELVISALVLVAIAGVALFQDQLVDFTRPLQMGDSVLFFFLNALTIILILVLLFLLSRNGIKLFFERRRGTLGSRLNLKFVGAFVLIATVPTLILFIISLVLINASIHTWFSLQVDQALDQSREVAETYYESGKQNALYYGRQIAIRVTDGRLLREERLEDLAELIRQKQTEYNLGVVEVFSATGEELVVAVNPEVPLARFSRLDNAIVQRALKGEESFVVQPSGTGDVIRGAVPIASSFRSEDKVGVVVVNYWVPFSLSRKVEAIRAALDEYRNVKPNERRVRAVYQMQLLLVFLVILLLATWWGFRLARGVTGPIRALAEGTAEVARGNLDVVVEKSSDDEIGFLVDSFNDMTRDLSEARSGLEQSQTEIEERRRYTEIVLRNVGAGVISIDAEGTISTINPSAQRILSLPPGTELVGRKLEEVLPNEAHVEVVRELSGELRAGMRESIRRQVQVPRGDEVLTLLITMTLLQDEDGRSLGMVMVLDDYSQLVRAQRMAAWREVARRIAHEIKNPLTPIQLSSQRIRRRFRDRLTADAEDAQVFDECVDTISSQVESLKLLVNEFSNFARLPAADLRPDDLNEVVREAVASYQGSDGVVFETHLAEDLPRVEIDRDQVRRLLTNLIDNAVGAIREANGAAGESDAKAGTIELRTIHDAPMQTIRLEVADDGPGIRPAARRRLFEPYYSTKDGGTGLGLAIVSRIVADHRGYIRVHENRPRGTRFIVELPERGA